MKRLVYIFSFLLVCSTSWAGGWDISQISGGYSFIWRDEDGWSLALSCVTSPATLAVGVGAPSLSLGNAAVLDFDSGSVQGQYRAASRETVAVVFDMAAVQEMVNAIAANGSATFAIHHSGGRVDRHSFVVANAGATIQKFRSIC